VSTLLGSVRWFPVVNRTRRFMDGKTKLKQFLGFAFLPGAAVNFIVNSGTVVFNCRHEELLGGAEAGHDSLVRLTFELSGTRRCVAGWEKG